MPLTSLMWLLIPQGTVLLQRNETPSRLYSAADLEAGVPANGQDPANKKEMDAFFKEVASIKVCRSCQLCRLRGSFRFPLIP